MDWVRGCIRAIRDLIVTLAALSAPETIRRDLDFVLTK